MLYKIKKISVNKYICALLIIIERTGGWLLMELSSSLGLSGVSHYVFPSSRHQGPYPLLMD
jgi:hypothetical protein